MTNDDDDIEELEKINITDEDKRLANLVTDEVS